MKLWHSILIDVKHMNQNPLQRRPRDDEPAQEQRSHRYEGEYEGIAEQSDHPDVDVPMFLFPFVLLINENDQHEKSDAIGGESVVAEGAANEGGEPSMQRLYHDKHHHELQQQETVLLGAPPLH